MCFTHICCMEHYDFSVVASFFFFRKTIIFIGTFPHVHFLSVSYSHPYPATRVFILKENFSYWLFLFPEDFGSGISSDNKEYSFPSVLLIHLFEFMFFWHPLKPRICFIFNIRKTYTYKRTQQNIKTKKKHKNKKRL